MPTSRGALEVLRGDVAPRWMRFFGKTGDLLVFPAASRPSISRRISLLPKILASERESAAPMVGDVCLSVAVDLRLLFGRIQRRARQCFLFFRDSEATFYPMPRCLSLRAEPTAVRLGVCMYYSR